MVFSTNVLMVEALKNGFCQCLYPQGESQLPPASLGSSPRSASGSDPGSFQITVSALGLGVCEILCAPFKSGVCISYSPLALLKVSFTGLQSQVFWELIFPVQDPPGWGAQCGAWTPSFLGRNFNYLPICRSPLRSICLDYTASPPLQAISL